MARRRGPLPPAAQCNNAENNYHQIDMSRKRIYNRVMDDCNGVCPLGELLTDKELERIRIHNLKRDWPNTAKVAVKPKEIYFSFGVRFAESYELVK